MAQRKPRAKKPTRIESAGDALFRGSEARQEAARIIADGLLNAAAGLGTSRDKQALASYGFIIPETRFALEAMWQGSWLGKGIVNSIAEDMTREWITPKWDDYEPGSASAQQLADAEDDFKIHDVFEDGVTWGRLYGGGGAVIGIKGQRLDTPLDLETVKRGSLEYIQVFDRHWLVATGQLDQEMSYQGANNPNFRMPLMYQIANSDKQVHWSRVVRFRGAKLPYTLMLQNAFWDASELQTTMEAVKHYDSTSANIASLVWEANVDVLKGSGLAQLLMMKDGEAKVQNRVAAHMALKGNNRLALIDKDKEDYEKHTQSFAGLLEVLTGFMSAVSGASGIPLMRLFGQSPAGFDSGDNVIRNYYDLVKSKQRTQLRRPLLFVYKILMRHLFGSVPPNFSFDFNPLWQMSALDVSTIGLQDAQRDKIYVELGSLTPQAATRELQDKKTYRTLEDDDVTMAEEAHQVMQEADQQERDTTAATAKAALQQKLAPKPNGVAKAPARG